MVRWNILGQNSDDQTLGWSLTLVRRGLYPGHVSRERGEGTLGYYYARLLIRSGQARSQTRRLDKREQESKLIKHCLIIIYLSINISL